MPKSRNLDTDDGADKCFVCWKYVKGAGCEFASALQSPISPLPCCFHLL